MLKGGLTFQRARDAFTLTVGSTIERGGPASSMHATHARDG